MPNRKTARKSNAVTLFRPLRSQSASVKQLLTGTIAVVVSSNANGTVIPTVMLIHVLGGLAMPLTFSNTAFLLLVYFTCLFRDVRGP